MSISYQAQNELVLDRQLEVQKVSIPFVIVGSATSGSVSVSVDEPALLFIRTQGTDTITPNLQSGETATYSSTPTDSTGVFNIMVRISEPLVKIVSLRVVDRLSGAPSACYIDAGGPFASNGSDMMISCTAANAINSSSNTLNSALEVEYVVSTASGGGQEL